MTLEWDKPPYDTPWTCEVLSKDEDKGYNEENEGEGKAENDENQEDDAACAGDGEDCLKSQCCAQEGQTCYSKDDWWAACLTSCEKGILEWDKPPYDTPWSC